MEKLAALNGEVVTIAVDHGRGRVVACTSDCDAAGLEHGGPGEASASQGRSALESMTAGWSPALHAAVIAGRLYRRILDVIERNGYDTLRQRAVTTRREKVREAAIAVALDRLWRDGEDVVAHRGEPADALVRR